MPFPLAHPAAVLPLRRYCPQWLSFPALVAGSLAPDAGYLCGPFGLEDFSHRFAGSFGFSLPVGMVMLWLFYGLRGAVVQRLPERDRRVLLPLCRQPAGSLMVLAVSVLVGAWTHLFLDSFTHQNGWMALQLPILRRPVVSIDSRTLRVCHVLWYLCSFAGITWLGFVYLRWRDATEGQVSGSGDRANLRKALLAGVLMFPMEALHHLVHGVLGMSLMAGFALVVIGVGLKLADIGRDSGAK